MSLRIPDAVGPLTLTADLRAQMVTTSVSIKAPGEGRPDTRVRWILRQLKNAPDDLRIETRFVGLKRSTAVLLGEVRDDEKKVLLPDDRKREPRQFSLSLARPMGIKRSSGPGGFVTETRQQAIDFYRELFQQLTEWRPKAPKLREQRSDSEPSQGDRPTRPTWEAPPEPSHEQDGSSPASSSDRSG